MFYKPGDKGKKLDFEKSRGFGHVGNVPTQRSRHQNILPKAIRNQQQSETSRAYTAIVGEPGDVNADFTNIQKAVDDVGNRGGGTILLREGTYEVDTQIQVDYDNITIVGRSRDETIVRMRGGADLKPMITVRGNDFALEDMTLDGNKDNQSGECSLFYWEDTEENTFTDCIIERVTFKNAKVNSIDFSFGTNAALRLHNNDRYSINECYFLDCDGYAVFPNNAFYGSIRSSLAENCGVGFRLAGETLIEDCTVEGTNTGSGFNFDTQSAAVGCFANSCATNGFDVSSADTQISIVGCLAEHCGNAGIDINGDNSTVSGCYTFSNSGAGIALDGSHNLASGNTCWGEDTEAIEINGTHNTATGNVCIKTDNGTNAYSAINLGISSGGSGAHKNIVTGNIIAQEGSTNLWNYGIEESTNSDNNLIHGNLIDGYNTGGISTSGASTTTADNKVI